MTVGRAGPATPLSEYGFSHDGYGSYGSFGFLEQHQPAYSRASSLAREGILVTAQDGSPVFASNTSHPQANAVPAFIVPMNAPNGPASDAAAPASSVLQVQVQRSNHYSNGPESSDSEVEYKKTKRSLDCLVWLPFSSYDWP